MKRIFGTKKEAPPPPSLSDATDIADTRIERLEQKITQLESELRIIRDQMARTKAPGAKNALKQKAMRILKQKKMYEGQRDQLQQQAFNMQMANFSSQAMQDTVTMVSAMKEANKQMKTQFKAIDVDSIEDIYDDMEDLMEEHNMMQDILSRAFGTPEDLDENELEAELEALGDELLDGEDMDILPTYLQTNELESVPTTIPQAAPSQEENMEQLLQTF